MRHVPASHCVLVGHPQSRLVLLNEQRVPPGQFPPQTPDPEPHGGSVEVVVELVELVEVVVVGVETAQWPPAGHEQSLPHAGRIHAEMIPCGPQAELNAAPHV